MKFNLKVFNKKKTLNYEQAEAYTMDAKTELYAAVVTTGLSDKFYEGADARMNTIRSLMATVDATYSAKLAVCQGKDVSALSTTGPGRRDGKAQFRKLCSK